MYFVAAETLFGIGKTWTLPVGTFQRHRKAPPQPPRAEGQTGTGQSGD